MGRKEVRQNIFQNTDSPTLYQTLGLSVNDSLAFFTQRETQS